jgi:small subunit ribosomal protein S4
MLDKRCRICRRAREKLFLKGERCLTNKCAFERRKYPPGQRGKRGTRITDYLIQLREKQKLKKIYGLRERQFKNLFELASKMKGSTGDNFISLLERRLDNVVYRMGFASSRTQARQLIVHGHILVDGRKVNIPSYLVKQGNKITLKEKTRQNYYVLKSISRLENVPVPEWISLNLENFEGTIVRLPERKDVQLPVSEHLIIEFYSKV